MKHDISKLTPQWLAGFFDGEGTVGVYSRRTRNPRYVQVSICQKEPEILVAIVAIYNGGMRRRKTGVYVVQWWGSNALKFLQAIQPFVICKKEKVEEAIKFLIPDWKRKGPVIGPAGHLGSSEANLE